MAGLNKSRFRDTAAIVSATFLAILFTKLLIGDESGLHEVLEYVGSILICICAVGRVYCTAFLGGFKNQKVVDYGPFAICRNPLYFFSFVGICGIALISNHIVIMLLLPLGFLSIYYPLIKREEAHLEQVFGKEYIEYKNKTPRFLPKLSLYHAPEEIIMRPKALLSAAKDSVMWFIIFPLIELVEYVQELGYIQPLFMLP